MAIYTQKLKNIFQILVAVDKPFWCETLFYVLIWVYDFHMGYEMYSMLLYFRHFVLNIVIS